MFCFPNTRQEILFPSNSALFTCISAHNQLRRKEKVSGSTRTSIGKTKHLGPRPAPPRPAPPRRTRSAPSTRIRFLFENGIFFSGLAYCQHVSGETHLFKTLSRVEILKTPAFRLRVDRQIRWCHTILRFQLEACSVRVSVLTFSCGRAKAIRIRYVWMCIFWKWRKWKNLWLFSKIPKISGYVWTGP